MGAGAEIATTMSPAARPATAAAEIPGVCSARSKAIAVCTFASRVLGNPEINALNLMVRCAQDRPAGSTQIACRASAGLAAWSDGTRTDAQFLRRERISDRSGR
ncbi:hypothetical protein A5775_04775 [Mycobacterium sp. 852002-10029_SCH5224772]|nr:hypothetical protein A5775_04775 [Mycobacterium sp. 852002-10029_SCH5224772]